MLIGYGKMGREIERLVVGRGHTISAIIDLHNQEDLNSSLASQTDVAIEFTTPQSVIENIHKCFELKLPMVAGTTGWHDRLDEIIKKAEKGNHSLFYASNFSIGVNLFFALNENLAELMEKFPGYNVSIQESHHTQKLDTPSGTAISLAEIIHKKLSRKDGWAMDSADSSKIHVKASRKGDIKGIHTVRYDSANDSIEITHNAKSRKGFATGAVLAAEYLNERKGIFTMRDLLGI